MRPINQLQDAAIKKKTNRWGNCSAKFFLTVMQLSMKKWLCENLKAI